MLYDREFLLHGEKRNAVLDLPEIHRYGIERYDDADYVSIYGLRPEQWYARGIRLLPGGGCGRRPVSTSVPNPASPRSTYRHLNEPRFSLNGCFR